MEQNIFEDSFLNTENYTTKVLSNSGFLSFVVVMVLYIIGYTYTYDSDSLYFANLFLLLLLCLFPLTWVKDYFESGSVLQGLGKTMSMVTLYKVVSVLAVILIEVIYHGTNLINYEQIRQNRVESKMQKSNTVYPEKSLNYFVKDGRVLMFIAFAILIDMAGETYFYSMNPTNLSGFMKGFGWLFQQVYYGFYFLEKYLQGIIESAGTSPLFSSFIIYSITFLTIFFGVFAYFKGDSLYFNQSNGITYAPNLFGAFFYRNHEYIGSTIDWLRSILLFVGGFVSLTLVGVKDQTSSAIGAFLISWLIETIINSFSVFERLMIAECKVFGEFCGQSELSSKVKVFAVYSFVFALSMIPILLALLQFLSELGLFSLPSKLMGSAFGNTLNSGNTLYYTSFAILAVLFICIFFSGVKMGWIMNDNILKLMNALLICNVISLIMGLSTKYSLLTGLYKLFMNLKWYFMLIVPLFLVISSLIKLAVYAFNFPSKHQNVTLNSIIDTMKEDGESESGE